MLKEMFKEVVKGASTDNIEKYYEPLKNAMEEFGIDTPARQVMFLAHIMVESGSLRAVTENLNYSAARLLEVFGKYYKTIEEANLHSYRPVRIASRVYANRMSNGDEASLDGWNFRGRGLKQLTGKANYMACGADLGYDLVSDPSYLETPVGAARSAAWFWKKNNLNKFADARDIIGSTKAINGGTNGLKERTDFYERGMKLLPIPSKPIAAPIETGFVVMKKGAKGGNVSDLQILLGITSDGDFGPATEKAVKTFQKTNKLKADGIVGPKTWEVLNA